MAELPEGWKTVGYLTDDGATIDTEALLEPKSVTFQMQLDKASAELYTGMSTLDMIAELQKKLSAPPIPGSLRLNARLAAAAAKRYQYAPPQCITVIDEMGYQTIAPDGSVLIEIQDYAARRFVLRRPDGEFVLVPDVQAWHWTDIYEPWTTETAWVDDGSWPPISQPIRAIRVSVGVGVVSSLASALGSPVYAGGQSPAFHSTVHGGPADRRSNQSLVNQLLDLIPGAGADVKNPSVCTDDCAGGHTVRSMVIHLNDNHRWTYQQIADWLDTLDVDLTIHTKED